MHKIENIEIAVNRSRYFIAAIFLITLMLYFLWFFLINNTPLSKDSNTWGVFGDYVGGVLNPIVALFAFYWLTKSVTIQIAELRDTKTALQNSEKAQFRQAEIAANASLIHGLNMKLECINLEIKNKRDYQLFLIGYVAEELHRKNRLATSIPDFQNLGSPNNHSVSYKALMGNLNQELKNLEGNQSDVLSEIDSLLINQ